MDAEKIHRWITQAELDAMLEAARQEGQQQAIEDSPTLSQYRDAIHAAKMMEDEARTAYRRGAEAMREAAAKEVFAFYAWSKDNEATRTDIKNLAEMIDALPVAKDKP